MAKKMVQKKDSTGTECKVGNHVLLQKDSKITSFFEDVCGKIQKTGNHGLVWIGLFKSEPNDKRIIAPVAYCMRESVNDECADKLLSESFNTSELGEWPNKSKTYRVLHKQDIKSSFTPPFRNMLRKCGISTILTIPLKYDRDIVGLLNVFSKNGNFSDEDGMATIMDIAKNISADSMKLKLEMDLKHTSKQLQRSLFETVDAITLMSEIKDPYTSGHQKKVALLASSISEEMTLPKRTIDGIYVSGLLHDVGKISVPNDILAKPGRLTEGEFLIVKNHPLIGYNILKNIEFPWDIAEIVFQHHEKLDGSGYPRGISGDDICLEAKILMVADVVEAMTAHRPYRPALGLESAFNEITSNTDTAYDKKIVKSCIKVLKKKKIEL